VRAPISCKTWLGAGPGLPAAKVEFGKLGAAGEIPTGWRVPNLEGCEVVVGSFSDQKLARHSHDALMLSLIDRGAQKVRHRGCDHIGGPGQIIAVPPHGVHACEAGTTAGWRYRVLMVDTSLLVALLPGQGEGFVCDTVLCNPLLNSAMEFFFSACGHETTLALEWRLGVVLQLFARQHAKPTSVPTNHGRERLAVARAQAFLLAHLAQNVSLCDVAAAAAMQPHRLIRAFTATVGLPPHAWHKQMRIRDAQSRLVRGEPVVTVAYATGFADQAHFSRSFRALTGVTPAHYRRVHHHETKLTEAHHRLRNSNRIT
jgi:AraC-like DNA-binding protein